MTVPRTLSTVRFEYAAGLILCLYVWIVLVSDFVLDLSGRANSIGPVCGPSGCLISSRFRTSCVLFVMDFDFRLCDHEARDRTPFLSFLW